jgi:soluble lytic murein transglycosylase-like protein
MIRIPLAVIALLILPLSAYAQRSTYSIDNFDFHNGVRAEQPAPTPEAKRTAKIAKRRDDRAVTQTSSAGASQLVVPTVWTPGPSSNAGALRGYTTGSSEVDGYLVQSGTNNGVDPILLYSVMHQESSFKSHAVSPKGARGLMQLMPGTAMRYGVTNIFDPRQNIEGGARYLRFLLDRFEGDVNLALAGYNAGEGAVEKYGRQIPPYAETQEYVRRISRRYSLLQDPNAAVYARPVSRTQLSRLQTKEPTSLALYERTVSTVRTPDGKLQLMSQ